MTVVSDIILAGTAAGIPAASSSNDGYLYFETDTKILKRSNGSTWVQVAPDVDITAYTDEQAQDAIGAIVDATLDYNDSTPSLSVVPTAGLDTDALHISGTGQIDALSEEAAPASGDWFLMEDGSSGALKKVDSDNLPGGGGGGGALVLLEQHTASASASLDFTTAISATYDDYMIEFIDVLPATDNVTLKMLLSTNGGSSYDVTSGHYAWNIMDWDASSASFGGSASDTKIGLLKLGAGNTANNGGVCGKLLFHNPGSSIYKKLEYSLSSWYSGGELLSSNGSGIYLQTTAVNAFQFLFSSGNIASGTIRVYGIAKS